MRQAKASHNALFLMELVITLFFFSLCAAICMKAFALSASMTEDSRKLSWAVVAVRSAADAYQACGGDIDETAQVVGGEAEGGSAVQYYDANWQPTGRGEAVFTVTVQPGADGRATVAATQGADTLFSLEVRAWQP